MYRVKVIKKAVKDIQALSNQKTRRRIDAKIKGLASDPRPKGSRKLQGEVDLWRVGVGDFRVIYQIKDEELVVLIVRVRDRKDAYRGL